MSIFGPILGGVIGSFLDGDGGVADANAANYALHNRINNLFRGQFVKNRLGFIKAEQLHRDLIQNASDTLDRSEADIRGNTRASKQAVHDNTKRQTSGAAQSLLNRGLLNSSVGATMQRGINADAQRQLSGIDAQEAGLLSQLGQRRAGLEASLQSNLANLPLQENSMGMNLTGMFANALGQQGHVAGGQTGQGSSLGGILGALGGGSNGLNVPGIFGGMFGF